MELLEGYEDFSTLVRLPVTIVDVKIRLIYWKAGAVFLFCCKIKCFRLDVDL
jgi:hypothetical protein